MCDRVHEGRCTNTMGSPRNNTSFCVRQVMRLLAGGWEHVRFRHQQPQVCSVTAAVYQRRACSDASVQLLHRALRLSTSPFHPDKQASPLLFQSHAAYL